MSTFAKDQIYTTHGFIKRKKGQRFSPSLLPTLCSGKNFKVKIIGEFNGFDSGRNPQVMQALCINSTIPAYRYKSKHKYNICQEFNFLVKQ